MAITTSINIQPLKSGSEAHNLRSKKLHYVREDLLHLNESWSSGTIGERLKDIKTRYQNSTGQKMQKKATPVREGVVVIASSTTMQQLRDFASKVEQRFGIKAFQIHIHKDEGYRGDGDWKANLHAHILFDWTQSNGKSIKLNRQDMAELQTLLAQTLQLERGRTSDAEHLSALQFKNHKEAEKRKKLQEEVDKLDAKKALKSSIINLTSKVGDIVGLSRNNAQNEILEAKNNELEVKIKALELNIQKLEKSNSSLTKHAAVLGSFIERIKNTIEQLQPLQLEQLAELCPVLKQLTVQKVQKKSNISQKSSEKQGIRFAKKI